jgi:signal peptidase I
MNKKLRIVLIIIGVIYGLFYVLGLTNALVSSKVNSISSEPNIKAGSRILASNLVTPENGDFVTLKLNDTLTVVHRLCAQENDKLEIKDGILYVNDKNADAQLNLMHRYKISSKAFAEHQVHTLLPAHIMVQMEDNDTVYVYLNRELARKLQVESTMITAKKGEADDYIKRTYHKDWNKDNFGPITVPAGKVFVLGDNRDNAEDSRYIGFIDKSKISGTIIYKQ